MEQFEILAGLVRLTALKSSISKAVSRFQTVHFPVLSSTDLQLDWNLGNFMLQRCIFTWALGPWLYLGFFYAFGTPRTHAIHECVRV